MIYFVKKLELNDRKYQTNGTIIDGNYKVNFLSTTKDFVSFGIDIQKMFYLSTRLLKYNIDGVHVPQFQLAYISDTIHP